MAPVIEKVLGWLGVMVVGSALGWLVVEFFTGNYY